MTTQEQAFNEIQRLVTTSNINEVSPEEKASLGRADLSFRIGNVPRFFLEVRKSTDAAVDKLCGLMEKEVKIAEGD